MPRLRLYEVLGGLTEYTETCKIMVNEERGYYDFRCA